MEQVGARPQPDTRHKPVRYRLDYTTVREHAAGMATDRLVLTHMSPAMLGRLTEGDGRRVAVRAHGDGGSGVVVGVQGSLDRLLDIGAWSAARCTAAWCSTSDHRTREQPATRTGGDQRGSTRRAGLSSAR